MQRSYCLLVVEYQTFIGRRCQCTNFVELNIQLSVEWVSRNDNSTADELSRVEDATDYMLDPKCFCYTDQLWGPHTVDRFASIKTSWTGIAVDALTLVVRLVIHLLFPGHGITIGFFHLPCVFRRF